tara:strand:+ start:37661 stop:39688 length:2028 start_codon:yes stop_codon:yes gene_type:complete
MCGIFGVIANDNSQLSDSKLAYAIYELSKKSESRGKDSSGISILNNKKNELNVFKGPIPASELIRNQEIKESINDGFQNNSTRLVFGHSRLVTNGSQLRSSNNQPVIKNSLVGIHNGIIVNHDDLWKKNKNIKKEYDIDTEVLLSIIGHEVAKNKDSLENILTNSINEVFGTVAMAIFFKDLNKFAISTNNGSLYKISKENQLLIFASEENILDEVSKKIKLNRSIGNFKIEQILPESGTIIDLDKILFSNFSFNDISKKISNYSSKKNKLKLNVNIINPEKKQHSVVMDLNYLHLSPKAKEESKQLIYRLDDIKSLKRCSKCILPSTFPYIYFDSLGVCNYCSKYKPSQKKKSTYELQKLVEPYKRSNGSPEVLVPFSGGRDSTYTLHIIKEELGLNPITFTYDWGMVTDLARRNIARTCGRLKVENIIVAANIHWKRKNINKNITAWLKKPSLGMIPLFMAGDKYFFYHAHRIKKQLGIQLEIWGVNKLENTDFKIGFAGIKPNFNKKRIYSLSILNQLKLFSYVGRNVLASPGYFNQSSLDSLGSIGSRYFTPKKDYFHIFDYINWNEDSINNTIINNYEWEKAVDTDSTWRIGDGTASFYNYVYTLVAGFSENDTFRSNQIREGMIDREDALNLVYKENQPRYNSLKWYLEIVGLDFIDTIKIINKIERQY